jgi:hypothetical protein
VRVFYPGTDNQLQFLLHSRNFDRKTTDKTQWEVLMELPAAKSTRCFPARAHMLMRQTFAAAHRRAC